MHSIIYGTLLPLLKQYFARRKKIIVVNKIEYTFWTGYQTISITSTMGTNVNQQQQSMDSDTMTTDEVVVISLSSDEDDGNTNISDRQIVTDHSVSESGLPKKMTKKNIDQLVDFKLKFDKIDNDSDSMESLHTFSSSDVSSLDDDLSDTQKNDDTTATDKVPQLNDECLRAIFSYLDREDLLNCSLVSKSWLHLVREIVAFGHIQIDYKLTKRLINGESTKKKSKQKEVNGDHSKSSSNPKDLLSLIRKYYHHASSVTVDYGVKVPPKYFNATFFLRTTLKHLTICGSIKWIDCRCGSVIKNYPNINSDELHGSLEKLETIIVSSTTHMSACCLLDIMCRAPKLKTIKFHGHLALPDHYSSFMDRSFPGNLKTFQWPWVKPEHCSTIELIIEKNLDLENVDSTSAIVCSMLSQRRLLGMKRLIIRLAEIWRVSEMNNIHIRNIKYLDLAKKLISLEIRSYDFQEPDLVEATTQDRERVSLEKESYMSTFWETVEKIPTIKALTVYGCWDFDRSCREVSKHAKNVEYLKINLLPENFKEDNDDKDNANNNNNRVLNIEDGLLSLNRLPNLKSLHVICAEKLGDINSMSCTALTKLADKLWILDVKVSLTDNVRELIFNIQRRGNPLNRTYNLVFNVLPKASNYCEIVVDTLIGTEGTRYKSIEDFDSNINRLAQIEAQERQAGSPVNAIGIWGLSLAPSLKCKQYHKFKSDWDYYCEYFNYDRKLQI